MAKMKKIIKDKDLKIKSVNLGKETIEKKSEISEQKLNKIIANEMTKEIVISQITELHKDINVNDLEKRSEIIKKIGIILKAYNDNIHSNITDMLKMEYQELSDINKSLLKDDNFIAFAFYFWNLDQMNFRIIGLSEVIPLLEIIDTREIFYLDIPTMSSNGIPIFWLVRGIPISMTITYNKATKDMFEQFQLNGMKPDVIRAMFDSGLFIKIFGKEKIPIRFVIIVALLMIIEFFVIYSIFTNMWNFR